MPDEPMRDADIPAAMQAGYEPAGLPDAPSDPAPSGEGVVGAPTPPPAPSTTEPAPTQADPVPEVVQPSWLPMEHEQPQQPQGFPPQQAYPQPMPPQPFPPQGFPQQPPQPQTLEQRIDRFVQDPDGYIEARAQDRFRQMMGPFAYMLQNVQNQVGTYVSAAAENAIGQAWTGVQSNYQDVLSKDEAVRSDQSLYGEVDKAVKTIFQQAAEEARQGHPQRLAQFQDPRFYRGVIGAVKSYLGFVEPAGGKPAIPAGAMVEGPAPASAATISDGVTLSPEEEDIARRMGPAFRERLIAGKKEAEKRGDVTFWE